MYFRVCETQHTDMHVTDTTSTPNSHQMAVVMWDRSIPNSFSVWLLTWSSNQNLQILQFSFVLVKSLYPA